MLTKCVELWERWLLHVSESPGPGTLVEPSHTSNDLFSSSYLPLFLNVLGTKLVLEENSVLTGGKRACSGPWPLTPTGQSHERGHPDDFSLSLPHPITTTSPGKPD